MARHTFISMFIEQAGGTCLQTACERALASVLGIPAHDRLEAATETLRRRGVQFSSIGSASNPHKVEGRIDYSPSGRVTISTSRHGTVERQRFTLAHEIGHYVVREYLFPEGWNTNETRFRSSQILGDGGGSEEELLANALAAELLLPRAAVGEEVAGSELDAFGAVVARVAKKYGASRIATVRRLSDVMKWEAILLTLIRRREQQPESVARVDQSLWFVPGESTRYMRGQTHFMQEPAFNALLSTKRAHLQVACADSRWDTIFDLVQSSSSDMQIFASAARSS